eukprot:TRINITY_DN6267_c0_g1_i5.p1 TRINITY_DN6267_c0_g1~~TRINITY_DN6267_c0_g1_i5.p1  ORF type:complete len:172 (-),score=54.44 TRINITY_DN6267_c0_g1_i5:164-679(-)
MATANSLLYMAIGTRVSSAIVADNIPIDANKGNIDKYVELTFSFMNTPQLQAQTLQEITTSYGICFGLVDNNDYVFLVLAAEEYPRSTLRGILNELKSEFYKSNPRAASDLIEAQTVDSRFIQELGRKYGTMTTKVAEAREKLQEVEDQLRVDILPAIANQEDIKVFPSSL